LCFRTFTPGADVLAAKYGLERGLEDVYIGRLRIAEDLARRKPPAGRTSRWLCHISLGHKLALIGAVNGMPQLLAQALRRLKKESEDASTMESIYPVLLDGLLWAAADKGHVGATLLLLSFGANASQRSRSGLSLLHMVAWRGRAEIVYVLVKTGGADINVEDPKGEVPGSYALRSKSLATMRVVKGLGGMVTLPRENMARILSNHGLDPTRLPLGFQPRFIVRVDGEPSDDESSSDESSNDESSHHGDEHEEGG
jgi:hypothetical protein